MIKLSYLGIDSFLDRIDALNKFLELVAVACLAYVITNPLYQLALLLFLSGVILILGKVPVRTYLQGMKLFLTFGAILCVMQVLFYTGNSAILFSIGSLSIKTQGVLYGLNLACRVFVLGSSVLSFIMTTEPRRIIYDMVERLKLPYRFAYGFYAALRFIPVFEAEAQNIMNAHAIRGANVNEKGLIKKAKVFIRLGAPLLVSGLNKAKISAIAMEARAFGAYPTRTQTKLYDVTWKGRLFALIPWTVFLAYLTVIIINKNWAFLRT